MEEIPDMVLELVMQRSIDDPRARAAASLVSHNWNRIDSVTRKHITIALCYSATPDRLARRFPNLESLKMKGKPRAAMFYNLIPDDWGGHAAPWVAGIASSLRCLHTLHFRRMIVTDADIALLVNSRGSILRALKLDKCSGFSTDGLQLVANNCQNLEILFLEESSIDKETDDQWLHDLAVKNSLLHTLNFYLTELVVSWNHLELLAINCRSLKSIKIGDCDISGLVGFFRAAIALEEFCGGSFNDEGVVAPVYSNVRFPPKLSSLGLSFMGENEMHIIFPFAELLKRLDLQYSMLGTDDHCRLIEKCPNLEILEARDVIGDKGLEVVARTCRKLQRLRVERGDDDEGLEDEQGRVTHKGLSAIAQGCLELKFFAVYVYDITNEALELLGKFSKKLCDFRLVLINREQRIAELPLDDGVRALLKGCTRLARFALYLRPGALTDIGLSYIGEFSGNITYMLLGCVGESDLGLFQFSSGCRNLQKLEMRGCNFSERALALAVLNMRSLRYIWVEGKSSFQTGSDLYLMVRPFWNIEFIPPRKEIFNVQIDDVQAEASVVIPAQVLAYYSLAGQRTSYPEYIRPLHPA